MLKIEIKHPNMLMRNKFLTSNSKDDLEYSRSLGALYDPEKLSRSFSAVKKQMTQQQRKSSTPRKYPRFGARLTYCPPSLKKIVRMYRYVFYSFSGLVFEDEEYVKENSKNRRKLTGSGQHQQQPTVGLSTKSLCLLAMSALLMTTYSVPLYFTTRTNQAEKDENGDNISAIKNSNSSEEVIKLVHVFALTQYQMEFGQLKPILSTVMQMVVYVFIIESFFNYLYNFFTGGRLIVKLATIPGVHRLDTSEAFAVGKMTLIAAVVCGICASGFALFNRRHISLLYRLATTSGSTQQVQMEPGMKVELVKLSVFSFMNFAHFAVLSLIPLLFYYMMSLFGRAIDGISESSMTVELNEANLNKIKEKVVALNGHFKETLYYFSLPLTLAMVNNVVLITGSCCFLMINQGGSHFFISLLYGLLSYAFLRLVVVCSVGNRVTNAYRELVRTLFENVRLWGVEEFQAFSEIRRMKPLFKVTFLGTYSLKQSTILAVLGFVLNYVVVLLQTESYGSAPSPQNVTAKIERGNITA